MPLLVFVLLAVGALVAIVHLSVQRAQRRLPPLLLDPGERVPTTPLQRMTRRVLIATATVTLVAVTLLVHFGAQAFWDDNGVRLTVTGLVLGVLSIYAGFMVRIASWSRQDASPLDERDQAILTTAPAGQGPVLICTIAVWMIALTEGFRGSPGVPTVYLYLIFWSCVLASVHAQLVGTLLGYRQH